MAQKKITAKAKPKAAAKVTAKAKPAAKAKTTPKAAAKPAAKPKPKPAVKPAAKPTKLSDFLIGLSKNPKQVASYNADPAGTMKKAGVSKKDMDVLLTRDGKKIRKHLGDDYPPGCIIDFLA